MAGMMKIVGVKVVLTAEVLIGTVGGMTEVGVLIETQSRVAVAAVAMDGTAKEAEIVITIKVQEARSAVTAGPISPAGTQQLKMRALPLIMQRITCAKLKTTMLTFAKHTKGCKQTYSRK